MSHKVIARWLIAVSIGCGVLDHQYVLILASVSERMALTVLAVVGSAASSPSAATPSAAVEAPPHRALFQDEPSVRQLALPGFEPAHIVLPRGEGRKKARLAVIAHGAGERPEPHCAHYEALLPDDYLLVCTRGYPSNKHLPEPQRGYFYDGHPKLGQELQAIFTLLATEEPYASSVELERALYVGFSQGASMGILALHERPDLAAHFNGVLLVDGGAGEWTVSLAKRMAERDMRVGIVCGQPSCREKAERSRPWLAQAGLAAELRLRTASHSLDGPLGEDVKELLPWLLREPGPATAQ
jgi:predicted esterase